MVNGCGIAVKISCLNPPCVDCGCCRVSMALVRYHVSIMYLANARKRIPMRRVNDFLACGGRESVRGMVEAMAIVSTEVCRNWVFGKLSRTSMGWVAFQGADKLSACLEAKCHSAPR